MNKITKAERQALYAKATDLLQRDLDRVQIIEQLQREGISKQRAQHAIAKARMKRER